jgi:uncharacterized membrane-anchored protein YjiN (DUF445 family)
MTVGPALPPVLNEAEKVADLRRMKRWATSLLGLATAIFAVALALEGRYPWLAWVRATAEAAMVGGLADWFAVTAIFRHPLGIPIPHTAIIPTRKARIAQILANFFEKNFFSADMVAERLRGIGLTERAGAWLADPANSRRISVQVAKALASAADAVPDAAARAFVDRSILGRLRAIPAAPVAALALETVTADARHQDLLDAVLKILGSVVENNEGLIRERIRKESPWWVPGMVDGALQDKVVGAIERTIADVAEHDDHPLRQQFDEALRNFIDRLKTSPATIARAEQIKDDLLRHPAIEGLSASLWEDVREALHRFADNAETTPPAELERAVQALGERLLQDEALRDRVDDAIARTVAVFADRHRGQVGQLIIDTVERWDGDETARRLELQVGRDLQYVRINGTLVGGLVGLVLQFIRRAF